ncbi:hypothetical protein AB6A40_000906 [Gnathostoma spinigerum]|uniref:Uncharacterized protein n=1 Tax=Gnathostoma spinigerum TaxID=75299 RepID=A0ABD6ECH4_9BILA
MHEITGRRAQLLNPALTRIPYKCVYDIVWTVPDNRHSTKSESDIYCVRIRYRVKLLNESDPHVSEVPEYAYDRDYLCEDEFEITTERATYELCAQLLSSQPGAVLCRVDNACDLIVSLRSLTNQVETVIISVVADKSLWHIKERHKLLHVKESGLGQTSFSVVPKTIGFLPYPSIAVYGCDPQKINPERSALAHYEQSDLGAKLSSFVRTKCKQVHVLGTFNASTDHKSMNNEKSRRLKGAKNRITKLFE